MNGLCSTLTKSALVLLPTLNVGPNFIYTYNVSACFGLFKLWSRISIYYFEAEVNIYRAFNGDHFDKVLQIKKKNMQNVFVIIKTHYVVIGMKKKHSFVSMDNCFLNSLKHFNFFAKGKKNTSPV